MGEDEEATLRTLTSYPSGRGGSQEFRVFAGTARNVEFGTRARDKLGDQVTQAVALTRVILETIDRIVELRAVYEPGGTRQAFVPSSSFDGTEIIKQSEPSHRLEEPEMKEAEPF